ncbi:hypothetical protein [Amycolatopsis echigonensis]|uniref:Uncharacterized protein n=1 Tax=Amycolatopsis echigonensis TaxID=2576905 RepID=A0A8E1W629_9PSEU|nr:hypothetical protein [Amycolatopsis echigonensis]MBB2504245.1 hypothetical protein [Amycolatopsis echigonensis]
MRTLVEVSGVVPAAPEDVFARLEKQLTASDCLMKLEVDRERRFLAAQGGWWYRGEYEVAGDPAGSRVTHRIRNAAGGQWWAVLLANRFFVGFRDRVSAGFRATLAGLEKGNGDGGTGRNG